MLLLLVSVVAAGAERAPGKAAIASAHPLATKAGLEILAGGGNAFDATVAVAAVLAVVEPNASGLGAGGFMLLHRASDGLDTMIDAREKAPAAATRDMFLDANGTPVPKLSTQSALAAGIPGEPAGLALLAEKYGKLPLEATLQSAIRIAQQGFPLYPRLLGGIRYKQKVLERSKELSKIYLEDGKVPPLGFIIKQPELAKVLLLIADKGMSEYYRGSLSRTLVREVKKLGGIWTEQDLADYRAVERPPVIGEYRGARIVSASLPASGGIALIDSLNILDAYDLGKFNSVTRKHVIVEALRRAHRDRAMYLGDSDFVKVPVRMLTSRDYAEGQRTSLRLDRATPSEDLPSDAMNARQGAHTTHFSVLDREGNRTAVTITLNLWFGSGLVVPGTGILLNNQMDDFSIKAGTPNAYQLIGADANAIAPGKRPLSSSTPVFVESPKGLMIAGTPGGSFIISMVLLATLDFMDGRSAQDIVSEPRFNHQYSPDVITYEKGAFTDQEKAGLAALGHKLDEGDRWGNLQVITWDYASGKVEAAADPRGFGEGLVY
jgi:gamma-glutamyltranspeptidase/glutathione hydrolase